jgi:hypothetical protein
MPVETGISLLIEIMPYMYVCVEKYIRQLNLEIQWDFLRTMFLGTPCHGAFYCMSRNQFIQAPQSLSTLMPPKEFLGLRKALWQ